jgi:cytochrome c
MFTMKKLWIYILILMLAVCMSGVAAAQEKGTAADAKALLKKAVAYIKEVGREKALAEFKNPKGKFVYKDLVIWCVDLDGVALVHPTTTLIGKNLFELRDADDKYFIKEEIATAKAKGGGTIDYRWTNLKTKKIERKRAFFEVADDVIVNCGYFI